MVEVDTGAGISRDKHKANDDRLQTTKRTKYGKVKYRDIILLNNNNDDEENDEYLCVVYAMVVCMPSPI